MKTLRIIGTCVVALGLAAGGCGKDGGEPAGGGAKGEPGAAEGGGKWSNEKLAELGKLDVEGFKRTNEPKVMMNQVGPWYEANEANDKGVKASVMLTMGHCMGMMCLKMDPAEFEKKKANLPTTMMLSKVHKDNPDMVYDIEGVDLDGKKAIAIYTFSFVKKETSGGGTSKSGTNTLTIQYNDGKNHVKIDVSGRGKGLPDTPEEYKAQFTKDEMMAVAKKFFAAAVKHF